MFSGVTVVIVLYLLAFSALHSLLASIKSKRALQAFFGPRIDRFYLPAFSVVAAVTLLPLLVLIYLNPGPLLYLVPSPWRYIMIAGQLLVAAWSLRAFIDAPHRFLVTAQLSGPHPPGTLDIRGIYCSVRDPFLLSGLLLIWMTPFLTENMLAVFCVATIYLFLGSLHWESRLLAQFGDDYRKYQRAVPRLIPRSRRCPPASKTS